VGNASGAHLCHRAYHLLAVMQEGHSAHATPEEAEAEAMAMIQLYTQAHG
jgi:hypothetical protein